MGKVARVVVRRELLLTPQRGASENHQPDGVSHNPQSYNYGNDKAMANPTNSGARRRVRRTLTLKVPW
jgi:hypothetical protein